MASVWIKTNDVFGELSEENNRLLNELVFAEQCLKKFNDLKVFIDSLLDKISIEFNDKQKYEELKNDIDNSLSQRSVLLSLKSERKENESNSDKEFSDNFDDYISDTESNEREVKVYHRRQLKSKRETDISEKDNCHRKPNKTKKSFITSKRRKYGRNVPSNVLFVCPVDGCEYRSYIKEKYRRHKQIHSEKKYKCPHCEYRSYRKRYTDQHIQSMHLSKVEELIPGLSSDLFKCDFEDCSFVTYIRDRYRKHQYIHSEKKLKCPHCDYRSYKKLYIDRHVKRMHLSEVVELIPGLSNDLFKCDFESCSFVTYKRKALSDHKLTHMEKKYECPHSDCDYRTVYETTLRKHLDSIHRKKVRTKIECPHSGCDYTGIKSYLKTHLRAVHNKTDEEKTFSEQYIWDNLTVYKKLTEFICQYNGCGKQFSSNYNLYLHIQFVHNKDSKEPLKCEFKGCKFSSVNPRNLSRHIAVRHSEKTLKCDFPGCSYGTGCTKALKQHQKTHIEVKPFGCDWPGCQFRSVTNGNLKVHMERHTGTEGQYKCQFNGCDKAFKTKDRLYNHNMRNHDKSQEYLCDWPGCEYKTYVKKNSERHRVTHSDDKPFACDWPGCQFRTKYKNNMYTHTKLHK